MQIVELPIETLKPYKLNSKKHPASQIEGIAESIKRFGFTQPIVVDKTNELIIGHGRLEAAKKLKIQTVPALRLENLSETEIKALRLIDNRIAETGWDAEMLSLDLQDINYDFSQFNIAFDDLIQLPEIEGLTDEDAVPEVSEDESIAKLGDIFQLGNHRLMCGDSTKKEDVDKLMDGQRVDMIFTDPPYNVQFNGRSGKHDIIKNDNLSDSDFDRFIGDVCEVIKALNASAYYVWCNWKFYAALQNRLEFKACIVWAKNFFGLGSGYRHQHEFCLFNGGVDAVIKNESDLWSINKDTSYIHPTQKPVALSVRAFSNHIKLVNVLDLFGGSGSTLIGAQQTGRKAFLMELDPHYCDVIIKRWQDFTGKQAVKL